MTINGEELIKEYEYGIGFKKGDILRPRIGCSPITFDVGNNEVVVLEQNVLVPHQYTVLGKRADPTDPSRTFVRFTIDGYQWEKLHEEYINTIESTR